MHAHVNIPDAHMVTVIHIYPFMCTYLYVYVYVYEYVYKMYKSLTHTHRRSHKVTCTLVYKRTCLYI